MCEIERERRERMRDGTHKRGLNRNVSFEMFLAVSHILVE